MDGFLMLKRHEARWRMRRRQSGFTLIELLIAVAIVAILASIALPSYLGQIQKTRRSDAHSKLLEVAQSLERCYSSYRSYDNTNCPVVASGPTVSLTSNDGYYQITSQAADGSETLAADTFTLRAIAQGSQAGDSRCVVLSYTHAEVRGAQDEQGNDSASLCW
jgi:type IV pilus assembly protein PilE